MIAQRTLKTLTKAVGVGLHSGQRVELTLRPAPPDSGIRFRRVDLAEPVEIPVEATSVTDTGWPRPSRAAAKVHTIEHIMSACAGLGVDNLVIDITAEEVPILDGSAASFVYLLQSAGIVAQDAPRRFIRPLKPVEVREGEGSRLKWARLDPYRLQAQLPDRVRPPGRQRDRAGGRVRPRQRPVLARDRARAHLRLHARRRDDALARPGARRRPDNAIVLDDYKVLNADGLRYQDEFAKHRSSTPWATSTSSASRCWRPTVPTAAATR